MHEWAAQDESATGASELRELSEAESLTLLGRVSFGRVVFSRDALPAIRPVNHVVDDGAVIIRTHLGAALLSAVGMVVAYEADSIDPVSRTGWTVILVGIARQVVDMDDLARYERMLRPWIRGSMDHVIRIVPETVTGVELLCDPDVVESAGNGGGGGFRAVDSF